ncbi:MAG TPA: diacylglycerol kinase family protein, partial [Labilithrix sp.]
MTRAWIARQVTAEVPGIGVVFNPRSGRNVRDPRAAGRLARALGDNGVVRETKSIDELYRVAEDFRKLDIDVLGISGGDGTNGVTITGFLDV